MSAETMTTVDPRRPRWILYTLLGVFGLLYAYAVWNAVAYMIPLVGMALDATTWVALVLAIAMPVIVSSWRSRSRGAGGWARSPWCSWPGWAWWRCSGWTWSGTPSRAGTDLLGRASTDGVTRSGGACALR
ncbi:hypothetical protein SAMN04488591_0955 [Microbacterium azadirachtae]|uniref:Uncharacterized protein n=1 Tax=Microbacterium azadirachtae TaxID=582680 RepID=A0A1I6GAX4_9MICO|nr:hypothetical protein [Microbacterium azadirachtae]SFR39271.1 hypothetical protein SAMN04488591_0955 [Microbacterium azadirachtae]